MQPPRIEVIPARPGVCRDVATSLDVLIRITPPLPEIHIVRPPINLGLVLDRSGSMSSDRKMEHAREAAIFAVRQLLPTDRLSVTIFDEQIETIVPSTPVTDKPGLVARIRCIGPRGSTALHEGWTAGAQQVLANVVWQGLNRVLLLSDGLANVGLTDPGAICGEVRGMASREVSTSTIGVGRDYNEELLAAMASAGAGNYYYVESSVQLTDIFQTELQGLCATTGRNAELLVRPSPGVSVAEVLTDLERGPIGQIKLPDLVSDMPVSIMIRLSVASQSHDAELARFQLSWDPTGEGALRRQQFEVGLTVPCVPLEEWEKMPLHLAVQEQIALLSAVKARDEYRASLVQGDIPSARTILARIRGLFANIPESAEIREELNNLMSMEEMLNRGDYNSSAKRAHYYADVKRKGRRYPSQES